MVSNKPYYRLIDVKRAVENERIQFSRKARRDYLNLGYDAEFAKNCLSLLRESDYLKSYQYGDVCCDAYRLTVSTDEVTDNLYIKFRLIDDYIELDVLSFHLG